MDWQTVQSTLLSHVAYEGTTLYVRFLKGGREYSYADVPADKYKEMLAAKSVGGYFLRHIKDTYKYTPLSGGTNEKKE